MNLTQALIRLGEFEDQFQKRLRVESPKLLGDLAVSSPEIDEMGSLIGHVISHSGPAMLQSYPLTVSLFLVWAAVYHYKEGNLWAPIFEKLGVNRNSKDSSWLGGFFLRTVRRYGLQLPPSGKHKKYMTPILMHGYISDHYTPQFLEYLNAIYASYLEYDLSNDSLADLWTDLFNIDQEQIRLKDTEANLRRKESDLRAEIGFLQVPPTLNKESLGQINDLNRKIDEHQKTLRQCKMEIEDLEKQEACLQEAAALFTEQAAVLEKLPESSAVNGNLTELRNLAAAVEDAFEARQSRLLAALEEAKDRLRTLENPLKVAQTRQNTLLREVVKLGDGNLESGLDVLREYTDLAEQLEGVKMQRERLQRLLDQDDELGNSSLRQVMTASLTSLGEVNPGLLQDFIKSTLKLLESRAKRGEIPDGHRLSEAVRRWGAEVSAREKSARAGSPSLIKEAKKGEAAKRSSLKQVRLQAPLIRFDRKTQGLSIQIPAQSMAAPRNFQAAPKYGLNYKDETAAIPVQYHIQRGRLNTAEASVLPANSDFSGITFQWLNFREYWEIKPEPLMVFASNGDLREGPPFPNGFYYILADDNWETDTPQITAKYRCSNLNNYTVYEFNGVESSLEFLNHKGERARLGFTRYRGISLAGVQYLPGIKQDGLPVARGWPKIIIDRGLVDGELREATFTLDYNGGRLHTASLASVCTAEKEESANYEINLGDFVPGGDLGNWQVFGVEIGCGRSEPLFKEEFCLVRAFSVTFDDGLLKVTVPKRSVLKGETVRQSAKTYWLSCQGKDTGIFEVFFNRVGWKEFSASVPRGKWQLVAKSNGVLSAPLTVLQWESRVLGDITLVFETLDPLVKRVVVSDDSDHLVMQLNVPRGSLEISLENFADLYEELETKSKIELYLEGPLGRSGPECVAEVFAGIDVEDVSLFIAEQEDEYVLEVAFKTNCPKLNRLCFRASTDNGEVLFQRPLRINPDYFYFKKD
ncbi:MAG: hypothetical protein GX335_00575, partial [Firmicutes bacterium]|nr:hypothetical protein [Bacillota bacterium]